MSDSEYEIKEESSVPKDLSLPDYIPLRREYVREFEQQFIPDSTNVIYGQQLKQVQSMADHYINYILANNHLEISESTLQKYIASLENLIKVEQDTTKLREVHDLPNVKEITGFQRKELTLETLEEFRNINNPSLPDVIANEFNNRSLQITGSNQKYHKFLKDALWVINHPEEAIPDDNEDDDLNISGGKVSLKDAITLNYYVNPVCSQQCGHTYEDVSIKTHLRTARTCPIAGCNAPVSLDILKPDRLMLMRIRAATRMERHNDRNLETVV